jgi:hypothetical protein
MAVTIRVIGRTTRIKIGEIGEIVKLKIRGQMTEDRRQRTEVRRQRTEVRRQKTEVRG